MVDVMSKLRNLERVTLNEIYHLILQSPAIRKIKKLSMNKEEVFAMKQNPSLLMKRNMEFLKSILIKSSPLYVVQEDRMHSSSQLRISFFEEGLFQ